MDEVHTFNDSRDDIKGQIKFYKEKPTHLHPPLFFILTHLFYPFEKPEMDLRIIPLIFGILSIPMIYLLSRFFSPEIALPCTLSLTFMTYHISLSQDGRSYSLIIFLGMAGLYFFIKHLTTSKKRFLILVALLFAILFHTSYSSIPFIFLSQILWLYQPRENNTRPIKQTFYSFLILNGLILLLCIPWLLFVAFHYKGQPLMHPFHTEDPGSFWFIIYGILNDWVPHAPLMVVSVILLMLFPLFSGNRKNAIVLLTIFVLPVGGIYLFCKLLHITHFVTSRYFVNFLPLFLISIYLSLNAIEVKFGELKRFIRWKVLFVILFIASNLVMLPLYYRSGKQDLRGVVTYLKGQLREGDKIFIESFSFIPGILHYFGNYPEGRYPVIPSLINDSGKVIGYIKPFIYQNKIFIIYNSKRCCSQYIEDGSRLWIIVGKWSAKRIKEESPCVLKGYFDGSFLNYVRFPYDASLYLFLWDPQSPDEKGIDMPIE
jgi:hypothetical protein